jgi:hypothetical protein
MTEMVLCSSTLDWKYITIDTSVALVMLLSSNMTAKAGIIATHMEYPDVPALVAC